jgi:hypothetical protein
LLANGAITKDVGRLTAKPTRKALGHRARKSASKSEQPAALTRVRVTDIENVMPSDMKTPNRTIEYFLPTFTKTTFSTPIADRQNKH